MITSKDNDLIKQTSKLINSAKYRKEKGLFIAEGVRLCNDAVDSEADIAFFLYTEKSAEKYSSDFKKIYSSAERTEEISPQLFGKLTDTKSPQGFMCIVRMKDDFGFIPEISGKYAALENIQDPSNMGTILRTAEALGIGGVLLSNDCCDVYSPKVVRGSMGAVFRTKLLMINDFSEYFLGLTRKGFKTYASTPRNAKDMEDINFSGGGIMLIGNEGSGLRQETISACSEKVKIQMLGRAESLNASAAAAILLYGLMRK